MRKEVIGSCELYLADSREVLESIIADCVFADPPYGVSLGSKDNNGRERTKYTLFEDTEYYVKEVAVSVISRCIDKFPVVCVTPGNRNMWLYPKPTHVGAVYYPAASGCNSWGFSCWQPLFYYGKDPHGGKGSKPDSFQSVEQSEKNGHPCPKPLGQMKRIVDRISLPDQTLFDPFMGSGTTGVACVELGRRFIGCEIEQSYFDLACRRIEKAHKQEDMFVSKPKTKQEAMI